MWRYEIGLVILLGFVYSEEICPAGPNGRELRCARACCESLEGPGSEQGFYCCDTPLREVHTQNHGRPERFFAGTTGTSFQIDYTLLLIGLIVSIVLSVLLSFFCCLLCNGCWLHRRRNPHMYETVNDSGFYPICCGFGIPMGTVVFSTHPPQYREENEMYHGSSTSSLPSSKQRVRFNPDGTPRGVLKNGNSPRNDY
ncbi:unnamed protein product, partial [Mesorhabditis belari]|uniref:Uncharacterized protein n=1 Tax=Mesorhabditis belari TaxID=2138241 RepID=A0AAF3FTV4_9BILA